jgi:hypothetical protein
MSNHTNFIYPVPRTNFVVKKASELGRRNLLGNLFPSAAEVGQFPANLGQLPANLPHQGDIGATRGAWGSGATHGRPRRVHGSRATSARRPMVQATAGRAWSMGCWGRSRPTTPSSGRSCTISLLMGGLVMGHRSQLVVCLVACVASNGTQVPDCLVVCKNTFIFAEPQHMYLVAILVTKLLVCTHHI